MFSTSLLEFRVSGLVYGASGLGFRFRVCMATKMYIGSRALGLGLKGCAGNRKGL